MCQCFSINQVTKHAEFPQFHVVVQRQAPQIHGASKTVEAPPAQLVGRVVDVPVIKQLMQRQALQIQTVSKTVENPTAQFIDRDVEAPVIMQMRQFTVSGGNW